MPLPGGKPLDPTEFRHEVMRAEIVETISQYCIQHADKIAEALIHRFDISRSPFKEKIA